MPAVGWRRLSREWPKFQGLQEHRTAQNGTENETDRFYGFRHSRRGERANPPARETAEAAHWLKTGPGKRKLKFEEGSEDVTQCGVNRKAPTGRQLELTLGGNIRLLILSLHY